MKTVKNNQPTERQIQINELYHKLGSAARVAKELGLNEAGVVKSLFYGARNGLPVIPDGYSPVAPTGWSSIFKTVQYNGKGDIVQTWDRVKPDEMAIEQLFRFLSDRTPVLETVIDAPEEADDDLMLEWLLMDHHIGLHSYGKETGADYDTKIATDLIIKAARKIFSTHQQVGKAVIVLGGDNIHSDSRANVTEKSKHNLDVDSRYQKTIKAAYCAMTTSIDIALANAKTVDVIVLSGNHDYHTAICLAVILAAHYRNNERVRIDTTPTKHKFLQFGNTYFMYTHGDTGSNNRLATYLMNHIIRKGIQGINRMFVRKGHLHKNGRMTPPGLTDEDGVIVELFPTMCAPDSYAHEYAFQSARSTVANIWHCKYGQRSRMEIGVKELMEDMTKEDCHD